MPQLITIRDAAVLYGEDYDTFRNRVTTLGVRAHDRRPFPEPSLYLLSDITALMDRIQKRRAALSDRIALLETLRLPERVTAQQVMDATGLSRTRICRVAYEYRVPMDCEPQQHGPGAPRYVFDSAHLISALLRSARKRK